MRKWFASFGVIGFAAATATGQVIAPDIADALRYFAHDAASNGGWKTNNPSQAGDWYSVDFDDDVRGRLMMGISVGVDVLYPNSPGISMIGVFPDNLALDSFGHTPDLSSPLSSLSNPTGQPTTGYDTSTTYDLPNVVLPTTGVSVALKFVTGDSGTWMDSDGYNSGLGHSFISFDNFATAALPVSQSLMFSTNWHLRIGTPHYSPSGAEFLINGETSPTIRGLDSMSLQLWGRDLFAPTFYLQELDLGGPLVPLPAIVLQTGLSNFVANGIPSLGELRGTVPCNAVGNTLTFRAFFMDNLDLKKNGHKKIKLTNGATVALTPSTACCPTLCFGAKDDGVWTGWNFKLSYPSASKDWYTVHQGYAMPPNGNPGCPGAVNNLLGVNAFSENSCNTTTSWAEVGIYQSNLAQDPTGNTPDVSAPLTSVTGVSAAVPPWSYNWAYPAVFYDTPDIVANTTTDYHTGMHWVTGDTCLWMEADVDGTADDLGSNCAVIPSATSFLSSDNFATNAVPFTLGNWMQRISWN